MKKRTNLTKLIELWGIIFLIGIGASIIVIDIVISDRDFNFRADQMRADYTARQKQIIKQEVEHVVDMIHDEKAQSEILTKTKIKSRVYEAYAIAQHIYQENKTARSEHEIQQMIINAISPIRFEKGNGYFFISRFDGVAILFPSKPKLEGVNLLNLRDTHGQYITKDVIKIVAQSGEGFYEYQWIKPHAAGNDFKKISFIKRLGFYDWFIGTGLYIDDVEGQIKTDLLANISRIRFEKEGYIFVNRFNGDALVSNGKTYSGEKKLWEVFNKNPEKMKNIFEKEYNAALKPEGDYIYYSHIKLTDPNKESPKVSFIYGIPELQWLVGAGVYLDDVETVIARMQTELNNQTKMKMLYFTLIAAGIVAFFLFLLGRLNHRLKKDFNLFISFFNRAALSDEPIDRDKVVFDELDRMAEDANRMLADRRLAERALQESEANLHDAYFAEATINMILSESLRNISLDEILQKSLNMILSVPVLALEPVGSIHLVEEDQGMLVMKAQYNLPEPLISLCANIPFGKCICGRTALTKIIEFADHTDDRHHICYEGMPDHGHYAVPILFGDKTLGVLNIYLKEGHIRNQKEEDFLLTVADTLAGIIVRKKVEEERGKLHDQLLQSQKMEAVGQLAGGIAHDFNNILTAMIGYGHLLKIKMKDDDPLRSYADQILALSDRAANLTQSLLAYSRKQVMDPKVMDLNEIIRKVERLLARIIGEDIQLKTILAEKELTIMADPLRIEQVFMNLATNARDAMHEGGQLSIRTEIVELNELFIKTHGYGKTGRYALISVSDTGSGIDEKMKEHIFEPFFTTKEVGKGTGLGLAMTYGIIKQHEGYINVYSESGKGTTFSIYLPLRQGKAEEVEPEALQAIEKGTETVLLAEDSTEVRKITKDLLEDSGYQVITAVDGQDAIDKFMLYKNEIQFILLDVIMPKKNGKEVYEVIKQIRPDIKVLFMSGYPADLMHKQGILEKGFAYIEKPASPTKLLRKIREVLDRH